MQGNNKPCEGAPQSKASRNLSLENLLQQAWLQSQRPKVQRRDESDSPVVVPFLKRGRSQSSAPAPLLGAHSGVAGDVEGSEDTYFHKIRPEALPAEFLRRLTPPELNCFSQKTDVKRSSSSTLTRAKSSVSDGCSQGSADSTKFSSSDECPTSTLASLEDNLDCVDFKGLGDVFSEWTEETEPTDHSFLDELLTHVNLEVEQNPAQDSAYHSMEKEIAELLVTDSDACDADGADSERCRSGAEFLSNEESRMNRSSAYDAMAEDIVSLHCLEPTLHDDAARSEAPNPKNSGRVESAPSDELMALKCMEGFTNMLSKHLQDVSSSDADFVDVRAWITEEDGIESQFDDRWTAFLDRLNEISPERTIMERGAGSDSLTNTTELLYRCALAVSRGDANATGYLAELRNHSSALGNTMERMAHYYQEALMARMSGTGETLYTVHRINHPSPATMIRSHRLYVDNCPYIKVRALVSQASILDAFEGATRVHLIHFGIQMGVEHAALIQSLSMRPGGPPHFRLTGIDFPHSRDDPLKTLHETGRRLEEFAKKWEVPFEYHALAGPNWELFTVKDFDLRKEEVLAVTSYQMHVINDEGVLGASPRELVLRRIRSLNPKVFSLFVYNAACNAPLFMTRFRESVKHFSALFEGIDVAMAPDAPERVIMEREIFGREVLNIVACEGQARIERAEPYRQWQNRMDRAGFSHRPMKPSVQTKIKAMMASFHKDFGVGQDDGWILMGIRNHIVGAASVWEPKHVIRVMPLKTKQPLFGFSGPLF